MFKKIIYSPLILTLTMTCSAVELYVAPDGTNSNDGSFGAPLASLEAARDRLRLLTTDTSSMDGATEVTVAAWVYPEVKSDNDGIVSSSGDYFGLLFSGYGTGNPAEFRAKGKSLHGPDNSCPTGQWHHIAGVWKSGQIHTLYVNGTEVANNPSPATGTINVDMWYIGSDRLIGGRYLDGNTRDVHVWKKALSASEIAALAATPSTVPDETVYSRAEELSFNGSNQFETMNQNPIADGAVIYMREGRYPITSTLTLNAEDSGKDNAPVIYSSYPGEEVILDGSIFLPTDGFSLVSDQIELQRLNPDAQGKVYAATLSDQALIDLVKNPDAQLSLNDRMLQQSRFPNIGFSFGDSIDTSSEVVKGTGTPTDPVGASFTLHHKPKGNWKDEIIRNNKARCRGYISVQWLSETHRIHSVDENYRITLMDGTAYGFAHDRGINRPYVDNLLCEIDEPGEWYFDDIDNKLYIYPPDETININSVLGVWAGPQMITINGNYIRLENLTMQCVGNAGQAFVNMYGTSNVTAGCTFRYSPPGGGAINIYDTARNSGALSCNFFDINSSSRLYGGSVANDEIIAGNCFIENCHFTQIYSKSFYGKVTALANAGNIFRNNLVHNMNGQIATISGVDHRIEFNEVFNVGIEEGDGGAFYSGAKFSSWNNVFSNNFFHHIINMPDMYYRGAIHADDGDLGDEIYNNVFYKGGAGFKINQGAGHVGRGNVVLEGIHGVFINTGSPTGMYNTDMNFLNTDPTSTAKDNHMGRAMRDFGVDGWETAINSANWNTQIHPYWRSRYPRLDSLMDSFFSENAFNKHNAFTNHVSYGTLKDDDGIYGGLPHSLRINPKTLSDLSAFEDPSTLNFKYKAPLPSWAEENHFEQIGLYTNEFRPTAFDKDHYRSKVKDRWNGTPALISGSYNPDTIADTIYYNSGKMIFGIPDPAPPTTIDLSATSYNYDVGPRYSYVQDGWEQVYPEINGGIQWLETVDARDRGYTTGINNANRDHVFSTAPATLEHKIANGYWKVTMNMGDSMAAHDDMRVFAEGELKIFGKDSTINEFPYAVFTVAVRDGALTLTFDDNGGADPEWVVSRLTLTKVGEVNDLSLDKFDLDPGPVGSTTLSGWTVITPELKEGESDIYWESAPSATDRGYTSGINNINRDFIHGTSPGTLQVKVANGPWHAKLNVGDSAQARDNVRLTFVDSSDSELVSPAAGTFPYVHLYGTVTDGYLTLQFSDEGGTDPEWLFTRMTLEYENERPVANGFSTSVMGGKSVALPFSGSDGDGDPLTFNVVDLPMHGTVVGSTYTADLTYSGTDTFTFTANDGYVDGTTATATVTVVENPDYDGDGINNLEEYAFGGDPLDPGNQGILPRLDIAKPYARHILNLRNDPNLTATVYTSTNLADGGWTEWKIQSGEGNGIGHTLHTNSIPLLWRNCFFKTEVE